MVHTALNAVVIGRNPHIGILVHLPAVGVENVVVVTDLREPLGADTTVVVVGKSVAAFHKARLDELAVCAEVVPAVAAQLRGLHIDGLVDSQRAVVLGVVVLAVQLIQPTCHLHAVNGEVQIAVLLHDLPDAGLQIGHDHLAVCTEVVHTRLHTVIISRNPHIGVLVHLAAAGVEEVVVVTDLREARDQRAVLVVIRITIHFNEAVDLHHTIGIEVVHAGFKGGNPIGLGDPVAPILDDLTGRGFGIVVLPTDAEQALADLDAVDEVVICAGIRHGNTVLTGIRIVLDNAVGVEVILIARQRQQVVALLLHLVVAVLNSRTILAEVIIVDLAVLLDNALQAGILLDDAVVDPIGVFADGVNAGNVLLEHAHVVKDAAGFFRCSIGDQCRNAGSRIAGFGVQIVGIAVDLGPTGLLQLAVLVVLSAGSIRDPAVPDLPLCIQRHISGQFKNCALIGIGGSAAICGSVPADEIVALTGKGVGIQGSVHTDFKALRLHTAFAAVGIEGDGVEHTGNCRVLCRISGILFSNHNLRTPAGEGVAVVLVRSLICAALEGRHGALQIIFLSYDLTINYPSDMCAGLRNLLALFQQFIADRAVGVAGVTGCRKRCFDRIANLRLVTGSRDHFLFNNDFVANRAVLAFRQARLGAGRSLCLVNDLGVAVGGDFLLCNENLVTGGAVLALSLAGLGAGRLDCRVDDLGVALGGNHCLCNENLVANGAVLALGLAGFGAGRLNCRINDLGMPLGRDFFLGNEYSIADRAVLAFGQTSLRAGRSLCCIDYFFVARCGDLFHTGDDRAADRALRTGRMTGLGAGGGLLRYVNAGVAGRSDCFSLGLVADRAGIGLNALIIAGGRGGDHAFIPSVALGGNLSLCYQNFIADGAMLTLGLAGFGAGRLNCRINDLGMALGGDFLLCNENLVTGGAVLALSLAGLGAGRLDCRVNDLGMALGGDHFLLNENLVADGAVLALGLAGFRAGRLDGRVNDFSMALGLNGFTLGDLLAADGTDCITGVAVLGAGGILLVDHLGERMIVLPLGVEGGVLGQFYGCFIRIRRTAAVGCGVPALEVVALAGEGVGRQLRVGLFEHGLSRHRTLDRVFRTAVGFKGNRQLDRRFAAPNAVDIVDGVASLGVLRLDIGAVGVVQLGGGDGDGHCTIAICIILIRLGLRAECALLNVLAGAVAGADIRTTPGGIDSTNRRYAAVHIHLRINQVVIGAVVCLTRRIGHGLKLAGAPDKVVGVPLIAVIEIDIVPVCNRQASALGNIDLNARQQCRILIDGHIAGLDIDGDVVGDGQYIACRVNAHACKL